MPIAIKKPKRDGEWGVFSYAPDRPAGGAASRKEGELISGGRPPASGFGSTEKVQERLGSSELVDRMRKERARATEASRARAAAAANSGDVIRGSGKHGSRSQQDGTGYRASDPNGTAYKARGAAGEGGDGVDGRGGNDAGCSHRPSPPAKQHGGAVAAGVDWASSNGNPRYDGSSGRSGGRLGATRRQGVKNNPQPSGKRNGPGAAEAGENVHAVYEERLAALERRLAGAGKKNQQPRNMALIGALGVSGSDGADEDRRDSGAKATQGQNQYFRPPPPRGAGEEWGAESNPFGYRKLSAGGIEGDSGPVPSLGQGGSGTAARSRGGSEASGGEDVEGLSTMYMGPISHKMAELRAGNG